MWTFMPDVMKFPSGFHDLPQNNNKD